MSRSKFLSLAVAFAAFVIIFWAIIVDNFFLTWLGWGLMFIGLEAVALRDLRKGDTLSEQVWLGTLSKNKWWSVIWKSAVTALLVWLIFHFNIGT